MEIYFRNIQKIRSVWVCCILAVLLFSCSDKPTIPVLTTSEVRNVTQTTAESGGNISDNGGREVTERGVAWNTSPNLTAEAYITYDGTGDGSFISSISGLTAGTKYYVRAYATNSEGTAYGNEVSFTTSAVLLPTVTTSDVISISATSASSGGNIFSDGGGTITARGLCWSTSSSPTIENDKTVESGTLGVFTSDLKGLTPVTTYYVRAYAMNSAGIAYGNTVSFKTKNQYEINDYWLATDGHGIKINGTYGSFYSLSSIWQEVANAGLIGIGSESLRSISQIDKQNWSCEVLWWVKNNGVYSIVWITGSHIKMSDDGLSVDIISASPIDPNDTRVKTFFRKTTKSDTDHIDSKSDKDQVSGY